MSRLEAVLAAQAREPREPARSPLEHAAIVSDVVAVRTVAAPPNLTEETRQVTVAFAGESATVSYRPNAFTLALSAEFGEIQRAQDISRLAGALEPLIAAWDLTFNGEPIPATAEGIARVPLPLLNAIQEAIGADMGPSDAEGKGVVRAFQHAAWGLHGAAAELPEWTSHFALAERLGIPVPELERTRLDWVGRAAIMLEAEAARQKALDARRN